MLRTLVLTTIIVSLAVFAIPNRIYALPDQKPCHFFEEGCVGGGTGFPPKEGGLGPETEGPSPPEGREQKEPRPWSRLQLKHGKYLD